MAKSKTSPHNGERAAAALREADQKNQLLIQAKRKGMQELLNKYRDEFAAILPDKFPVDRLISAAMACMARDPELLDCTPSSIISSLSTVASLGLLPDGVLGECYLQATQGQSGVSYCEMIVGYKGLITLATRSGQVQTIQAKEVYRANDENGTGDELEYEHGLRDVFRHRASGIYFKPEDVTHFWVKVVLMNGGILWDVWTRKQVEAIRDETKEYKAATDKSKTFWGRYFVAMACSKLLRAILKTVTLSPDLGRAIALSEMADAGVHQQTEADYIDQFTSPEFQEAVYENMAAQAFDKKLDNQQRAKAKATGKGAEAIAATKKLLSK
jgi:recombination protein RecT